MAPAHTYSNTGAMEEPSQAPWCPASDSHPENLPHKFLPPAALAQSRSLSHTLIVLSDSSHEPQALLVLTTHLDLFSGLIIHRSQLAHPHTPPAATGVGGGPGACLTHRLMAFT